MQSNGQIESGNTFIWNAQKSASEKETKEFWERLRHFYRTGEKPESDSNQNLKSVFWSIFNADDSPYPYEHSGEKLEFGPQVPFQLLYQQIESFKASNRNKFKVQLQELIVGLNKLLSVKEEEEMEDTFDFATEIIAFDKLSDLIPASKGDDLSKERSDRLKVVVDQLKKGIDLFNNQLATVLVADSSPIIGFSMPNVNVMQMSASDSFHLAERTIKQELESFTELIKSVRIAKLEIEGEYTSEVHEDYFDHFSWYRLSTEERELFHPFILIVNSNDVIDQLENFSRLISFNWPIKILTLNDQLSTTPQMQISWEDASHRFRQEISTLAIAQRSVFTFQSTLVNPECLAQGLNRCLQSTSPCVLQLLIPSGNESSDYLLAEAAKAGRYFPSVQYDPSISSGWEARFSISENDSDSDNWISHELLAKDSSGVEHEIPIAFTYADYKSMFDKKVKELMVIPSQFDSDYLVPLDQYIELEETQLYGKIPYIWLVDEKNELHRAAIPNVWVVSTQERLDFWNFLQELNGVSAKESEGQTGESLLTQIKEDHKKEIEQLKSEAFAQATQQLINALLEEDQ